MGQWSCLFYNLYVASSVTSQGRAYISAAMLCFEMILNNNVKFGSINEVMEFINHVVNELPNRKFDDNSILDKNVTLEDCFSKVILSCGYRWIPNEEEMNIIWRTLQNLSQENLNRVYYKNNLFAFTDNSKIFNIIESILRKLNKPFYNSLEPPVEIIDDLKLLSDLIYEYVYYRFMIIDRIDRCDTMIKSVIAVSDTDSAIVSLDGWYRYVSEKVNGKEFKIANYTDQVLIFHKPDDEGNPDKFWEEAFHFEPKRFDYNFMSEEIEESYHVNHPEILTANDNMRYSIISIMAYVLGNILNDYMEKACENFHSLKIEEVVYTPITPDQLKIANEYGINFKIVNGQYHPTIYYKYDRKCKMFLKTEFLFRRILMTSGKKHYASMQILQEGKIIPDDKQLDVKGIDILLKSTTPVATRQALKNILLEDIMKSPSIDQVRVIKDLIIFEKQLIESIRHGNRDYYKPATVKSMDHYSDPMRIQGIKASLAWNMIKASDYPAIDLNARNAVDIAKVNINKGNADRIAAKYPEVYNNILATLNNEAFKNGIEAIAIPLDIVVPEWITEFVDYDGIIRDNINPFPLESVGVTKMDKKNIAYTNIVQL